MQACFEGLQVVAMESVVLEIDIFVSSTVNSNFSMKKFKNKAFVENTGHLDNEIDWAGRRESRNSKPQ